MSLDTLGERYGFSILAVLAALVALVVSISRAKKRIRTRHQTRSLWDYVLLWPLILDRPARRERVARGARFLTTRELIAGLILFLVMVLAVTLTG